MIEATSTPHIDFLAVTVGALVVCMLLEMLRPARDLPPAPARWANNALLALLTYGALHLLGTWLGLLALYSLRPATWPGLSSLPLWLDLPLAFLAIELLRYALHVAMHKVPILWRLHAVHHADDAVDVSTAFRHHPLEGLVMTVPMTVLFLLLASAPVVFLIYRTWDLVTTVFTHTNVALPAPLERCLRVLVVTPAFHRTHHFAERQYTDSNYSSSLPWFDYLFRTYRPTTDAQQRDAALGLDTHTRNEQRLDGMLLAPFVERR